MKLKPSFYNRADVVQVSKDLLGKYLYTRFNDELTGGIITETEAYNGAIDKASHAFNNRRTNRTEVMFAEGGTAYVYICYGIHHLFNVVTNKKDIPHAVLVRAIHPVEGIDIMLERRNKTKVDKTFSNGPGTVGIALGIHVNHNGKSLSGDEIWIEDKGLKIKEKDITIGPRIGVESAGKDALLPYRFRLMEKELFKYIKQK